MHRLITYPGFESPSLRHPTDKAPSVGAFLFWVIQTGLGYSKEEKITQAPLIYCMPVQCSDHAVTLPPFIPPTLAELRKWYCLYKENGDVWRLILEVQHQRELLAHLKALLAKATRAAERSEFGRLTGEDAPLREACAVIDSEIFRIGPIGGKGKKYQQPERSIEGAAAFDFDPDDPADQAAYLIARAHQKRR